jgi:hypothetical protein
MNLEILLTTIFFIVGGIRWLYEYIKKTNWEKTKFLSEKMEIFFSDEKIKDVLNILDYNQVVIKINNLDYLVSDSRVIDSLITHDLQSVFTEEQKYIRDLFDYFFNKLSQFQIYIDTDLVREKDVITYLKYYLNILDRTNKTKTKIYIKTIMRYIEFYNFEINFIRRFD